MPDDDLPFAGKLINHRRRVTWFLCAERAPEFLAGVFVECDGNAAIAAGETNEFLSIRERMTGEAPHWSFDLETFFEVVGPNRRAFLCIEAKQISFRAQRINFS